MGSYGRPVLEAAYGEIVISLHRDCLRDVSLGRMVKVSTWCITHGRYTWVNTSVSTVYVFSILIQNLYVICFQRSICIMKRHWWFLTLSWPDNDQRMFSTAHDVFFKEMKNLQIYRYCIFKTEIELHICFIYLCFDFILSLWLYLSITEHIVCSHSYCFLFTG